MSEGHNTTAKFYFGESAGAILFVVGVIAGRRDHIICVAVSFTLIIDQRSSPV